MKLTLVTLLAAVATYLVTRGAIDELARRAAVRARTHRGLEVAATGGIALVLGLLAAAVIATLASIAWSDTGTPFLDLIRDIVAIQAIVVVAITAALLALLGLYEDLAGDDRDHGWGAHLRALRERRATPGAVTLAGGSAAALIMGGASTVPRLLVAAAIIALSAHLGDKLDGRPLRAFKSAIVWLALLLAGALLAAQVTVIPGLAVLGAAVIALWKPEASERISLGHAGSHGLGAALGALTLTGAQTDTSRLVILGALIALTVISVKPGFSALIAKASPLARLDAIGRQPDPIHLDAAPDEPM